MVHFFGAGRMWKELVGEKVLVVGLGEVGRPLFDLLRESGQFTVYGFDTDNAKMREAGQGHDELPSEVNVMHVCLPCNEQDKFVSIVVGYAKKFSPRLLIINSTVPPGTTLEVSKHCRCLAAHSPVRGVHKRLGAHEVGTETLDKIRRRRGCKVSESRQQAFPEAGLEDQDLENPVGNRVGKTV